MTPEGKVKEHVKRLLRTAASYHHMPVQNGMGSPTLDFTGCCRGFYYTIETKKLGGKPTKRQLNTMREVALSLGSIFLIDSASGADYDALAVWLMNPCVGMISPAARLELKIAQQEGL